MFLPRGEGAAAPHPIRTNAETVYPLHRSFWNPGFFSKTTRWKYAAAPLEDSITVAPCFTVNWGSRGRSQDHGLGTCLLRTGPQEGPRGRLQSRATSAPKEKFISPLYFVQNQPFFNQILPASISARSVRLAEQKVEPHRLETPDVFFFFFPFSLKSWRACP